MYLSILLAYKNKREGNKSLLVIIEDRTIGIKDYVEPIKNLGVFHDVVCIKGYTPVRKLKKEANKFNSFFKRASTLKSIFEDMNPHLSLYDSFISNSEIKVSIVVFTIFSWYE